ncbi:hypothetical protein LNKW23_18950 [Paralimibaculum aggregatum]|uniref:Putative regulatory protein FmdB zinc ribbon domain-containing protein n=1 Tax=Paralimibaculum aggregatum TaxID=3036245 RepID=A0ABQ6LHB4_9RHOB|nr:FmdB family zinc ribbon protein [Limibaculum sp. NKW23]GMG82682.1 hypothetical protein LNKW23_18950 [Limibaculum sp. NKW23]
MPIYGYLCTSCGPFESWATLARSEEPCTCPSCGAQGRREVALPHLAMMNASLRSALDRSEKSSAEPKVVNKKHLAGCGCPLCKMGPKGNQTRKKWSIGH